MIKRGYTCYRPSAYRDMMLDSLTKRVVGMPLASGYDLPKDQDIAKVNEMMRGIVSKKRSARDNDIFCMHQDARLRGLLAWCKENIDYLAENGYRLFAVECDIDRFVSLVSRCAGYLRLREEDPDACLPLWFRDMTVAEGDFRPPINARIVFGPEEKELLATAYARLLGVRTTDLFDAQWRARFSEDYLASCLREMSVLTDAWPDFERMEHLLRNNA